MLVVEEINRVSSISAETEVDLTSGPGCYWPRWLISIRGHSRRNIQGGDVRVSPAVGAAVVDAMAF